MTFNKKIVDIVAARLCSAGKQAYLVGGSVRDHLLGISASDLDFATDAKALEVKEIFESAGFKVVATGIKHGTVTVFIDDVPVEITTFRVDGKYTDGRRPDSVTFVSSIEDDLSRRDFTVNAIALNPLTGEIVDPFGGEQDLKWKILRAVGSPRLRFDEDGLRALRACRLAAKLGFKIESDTLAAIAHPATKRVFARVSRERVKDELLKGLKGDSNNVGWFLTHLIHTALLFEIFPELKGSDSIKQPAQHHRYDVLTHSFFAAVEIAKINDSPFLRLVALLHDIGKPSTWNNSNEDPHFYGHEKAGEEIIGRKLEELKFSSEQVDIAKRLVLNHLDFYQRDWSEGRIKRWIQKVAIPRYSSDLSGKQLPVEVFDVIPQIDLAKADLLAHGTEEREVDARLAGEFVLKISAILEGENALTEKSIAISGNDIIALGVPPGKEVGRIKKALLEKVLDDFSLNNRETLISLAKEYVNR